MFTRRSRRPPATLLTLQTNMYFHCSGLLCALSCPLNLPPCSFAPADVSLGFTFHWHALAIPFVKERACFAAICWTKPENHGAGLTHRWQESHSRPWRLPVSQQKPTSACFCSFCPSIPLAGAVLVIPCSSARDFVRLRRY